MASLYFDCTSGISGDMIVAALLDAGADEGALQTALDSIPAAGFKTKITRVTKNGIAACDFDVILENENHDHDMEFLFGKSPHGDLDKLNHHGHSHEHGEFFEEKLVKQTVDSRLEGEETSREHDGDSHSHGHSHNHGDGLQRDFDKLNHHEHSAEIVHVETSHSHKHEHRGIAEIFQIIEQTKMTESAKNLAKKTFDILADAESAAHAKPKFEVHFHEVGALDSIVDIISAAVCFDSLNITRVFSTPLTEGTGTIRCAHGMLSVPVPAVANILAAHSIPLQIKDERGEFVTPTGAAFLAAIAPQFSSPKNFTIKKIGTGAGKRAYENPSLLRAFVIEEAAANQNDTITKLECNIDDCTGENLGFLQERLFENGARDVTVIPCFMKKNRPAFLLQVICDNCEIVKMESLIFENTTTIGIRRVQMERTKLVRRQIELQTSLGKISAKEVIINGKTRVYPEYESVKKMCEEKNLSFVEVMKIAQGDEHEKVN